MASSAVQVNVRLTPELHALLVAEVRASKRTTTAVVSDALERALPQHAAARQGREGAGVTAPGTASAVMEGWRWDASLFRFVAVMLQHDPDFDVTAFLEKPWHWERELQLWLDHDRPTHYKDDDFEPFCEAVDAAR